MSSSRDRAYMRDYREAVKSFGQRYRPPPSKVIEKKETDTELSGSRGEAHKQTLLNLLRPKATDSDAPEKEATSDPKPEPKPEPQLEQELNPQPQLESKQDSKKESDKMADEKAEKVIADIQTMKQPEPQASILPRNVWTTTDEAHAAAAAFETVLPAAATVAAQRSGADDEINWNAELRPRQALLGRSGHWDPPISSFGRVAHRGRGGGRGRGGSFGYSFSYNNERHSTHSQTVPSESSAVDKAFDSFNNDPLVWEIGDNTNTAQPARQPKWPKGGRRVLLDSPPSKLQGPGPGPVSSKILSPEAVQTMYAGREDQQNEPRFLAIERAAKQVEEVQASRAAKSRASAAAAASHKSSVHDQKILDLLDAAQSTAAARPKSQWIVERPDEYEVPATESVELLQLPEWESQWKQVEKTLPQEIQDIPSPVYAFSRKRHTTQPDPATIGAVRQPAPQDLTPIANPLDFSSNLAAAVSRVRSLPSSGYAESEFSQELAAPVFKIVGQTSRDTSRWKWFSKPAVSVSAGVDLNDCELDFEFREFDKTRGLVENFAAVNSNPYQESDMKRFRLVKWLTVQTLNTIKCPMVVDMSSDDFASGLMPSSGVRFHYQEFPPDLAHRPVRLHYGPIEWDAIPSPRLNEPLYRQSSRFNQTSTLHIVAENSRKKRRAQEEERRRMEAEAEESSTDEGASRGGGDRVSEKFPSPQYVDPALPNLDSSNPWIPSVSMFIRPARKTDVQAIQRIYNYHVAASIDAPETMNVAHDAMLMRIQSSSAENYPFLVAVMSGNSSGGSGSWYGLGPKPGLGYKGGRGARQRSPLRNENSVGEPIIGFARARSWSGVGVNCFDDTALLEVYVHSHWTGKRVGSNLLDRLVGSLDTDYRLKQGVRIETAPDRLKWNHGWRSTYAHMIRLYYHHGEDFDFLGKKRLLESQFGFRQVGTFPDMCSKDGGKTRYSMAYLQRPANRLFTQQ